MHSCLTELPMHTMVADGARVQFFALLGMSQPLLDVRELYSQLQHLYTSDNLNIASHTFYVFKTRKSDIALQHL